MNVPDQAQTTPEIGPRNDSGERGRYLTTPLRTAARAIIDRLVPCGDHRPQRTCRRQTQARDRDRPSPRSTSLETDLGGVR